MNCEHVQREYIGESCRTAFYKCLNPECNDILEQFVECDGL